MADRWGAYSRGCTNSRNYGKKNFSQIHFENHRSIQAAYRNLLKETPSLLLELQPLGFATFGGSLLSRGQSLSGKVTQFINLIRLSSFYVTKDGNSQKTVLKVALNPMYIIFLTLPKVASCPAFQNSVIRKN